MDILEIWERRPGDRRYEFRHRATTEIHPSIVGAGGHSDPRILPAKPPEMTAAIEFQTGGGGSLVVLAEPRVLRGLATEILEVVLDE